MDLASTSSAILRIIEEEEFGVTPETGDPQNMRITGESLKFNITKEDSKEINNRRTISSVVPVSANSNGTINTEIFAGDLMDDLLAAVLQGEWSTFGTNGLGAEVTAEITPTTITSDVPTSGNSIWTQLRRGQFFRLQGDGLNGDRVLRVSSTIDPTASVITLDPATPALPSSDEVVQVNSRRLTHGDKKRSFTIERENSDIGVFIAYRGNMFSKMTVTISSGAISGMAFDVMGRDGTDSDTTTLPGTPRPAPASEIHSGVAGAMMAVWMDGAPLAGTHAKSITLEFDNTMRAQDAIGSLGAIGIGNGTISCTVTTQVYFKNRDSFTRFKNNQNSSFAFGSTDMLGNGYLFSLPKVNTTDWTSNAGSKDQDQMVDLVLRGLEDSANPVEALRKLLIIDRIGV